MDNENFEKNSAGNGRENYYGVGSFLFEIVKIFLLAVVIILPIRVFLLQPFFVKGASMEPNFEDGEYLIINELGYKKTNVGAGGLKLFTVDTFKELKRGDVVVFRYPKDPSQYFIKRIIALPGEKIKISDNQITIYNQENPSGFVLDESGYLSPAVYTNGDFTIQLSGDDYYVMGDNRTQSHDSRAFGPVNKDKVVGRVLLRAWPIGRAEIY